MKTRLLIVRHAEAEGNVNRKFHGWTDSSITEKGHIQAKLLAEKLKDVDIDVLYSSSLKRTLQTAQYISEAKQLPIIRTDKLKEINGGDWEERTWDELPKLWPKEYETWETSQHIHQMPNGESMSELQDRVSKEIEKIISQNHGKNICIVTHGTAIKTLICYFKKLNLCEMRNIIWHDNTSVTIVDYVDENYEILAEGDASHLTDELSTVKNQDWWEEYSKNLQKNK